MRLPTVWVAAFALCVPAGGLLLARQGGVGTATVLVGAALAGLLVAWLRSARRARQLAFDLERESARAATAWTQAWQNALLAHATEELRGSADPAELWGKAAEALGRALEAARVVVYRRDEHGTYRAWSQFAADGRAPLSESVSLPSALVHDRDLSAKLASLDFSDQEDAEIRALAGRPRTLILVPVEPAEEEGLALAVHPVEEWRRFTEAERRFVQRFADHVARLAAGRSTDRRRAKALERSESLVDLARALAPVREAEAVCEIAIRVGAPLVGAERSALLVPSELEGFSVAAERGLGGAPSPAALHHMLPLLEEAVRRRGPIVFDGRLNEADASPGLIAPLFYGRELLGLLLLTGGPGRWQFRTDEIETARRVAELTAVALKNARLFETYRSAEELQTKLIDASPDLLVTVEGEGGRVLDCRGGLLRGLGMSKSELVGLGIETLLTTDCLQAWRTLERDLKRRESARDAFLRLRARDGGEVDVLASGFVASRTDSAAASPLHLIFRDVTQIARLEHQLRQSQKLELAGSLAGGVAHDLNNVLGGVLGYASLLRNHVEDRPAAGKYVETIERSATRGAELIGRLLAASRKRPARREAVSLNLVVEETLELLAHTVDRKIRIEKSLDPAVHAMIADPSQLQQIVLNLCVNARDAMRDGGLLRVETRLEPPGERVRLTVEDTGVGMDSKTIERLFEPFFSTKGERGTGLGLSVVHGVVQGLGGDIRVQSSPGRGARFDVFLPCQWAEEGAPETIVEMTSRGDGELILIVDDEKVLRDLGKEILEANGYRVETVGNGEDAIEFVRTSKERVALVILDVVMPGIDGGETLRRLRRQDAAVPVLLSTGLSAEESVQDLLTESGTGFIGKPYGMGELTRAVGSALKTAQLMH